MFLSLCRSGTGLLGEQLRDLAPRAHLVAVDLSAQMLQKASDEGLHSGIAPWNCFQAQAKGCYDELHCSEMIRYLMVSRLQSAEWLSKSGCLESLQPKPRPTKAPEHLST